MSPRINLGKTKVRDRTVNKKAQQAIYQNPRWKRLRKIKFQDNPLCELCEAKGIVVQTQEVHHIRPWETGITQEEQQDLAYDYDNLLSVCVPCHKEEDRRIRKP